MSETTEEFRQNLLKMLKSEFQLQVRAQRYWGNRLGKSYVSGEYNILGDMETMNNLILSNTNGQYAPLRWHEHLYIGEFIDLQNYKEESPKKKFIFNSFEDNYLEFDTFETFNELLLDKVAAIVLLAKQNNLRIEYVDAETLKEGNTLFAEVGKIERERISPQQRELNKLIGHTKFMQGLIQNLLQKQNPVNAEINL